MAKRKILLRVFPKQFFTEAQCQQYLASYEQDFSKHVPNEVVPHIGMLFYSIPTQLNQENKKFIYDLTKEGASAKEYELAILWLTNYGLL